MRTEDGKHTAEALLGMTASALRMNDLARARRDCSMALELADDAHDESLAQKSLGYFATLYVVADTVRIPEDLLRRIEQSVLCDTTVSGMCTRARTQLLRNRPAEALRSIEMAARRILRAEDRPMLLYTAYRANMQAGNYREAARQIDRFICLNDSLTRTALQSSADMIEKEYFRERAAFYDYRLEHRRKRELAVIGAGILLLGIAGCVFRQQIRLHKRAAFASRAGDAGRISRPFRTHGAETAYRGPAERCDSFPVRNRGSHREDTLRTGKHRFRTGRDGSAGA